MGRAALPAFFAFGLLLYRSAGAAEGFDIDLQVKSAAAAATAHSQEHEVPGKTAPRPQFKVKAGQALQVTWKLTNVMSEKFADVIVHCYVVEEEKPGQNPLPRNEEQVPFESAVSMDFKPSDHTGGKTSLKLTKPGFYLLRVETIGLASKTRAESFSTMDLVVE